MKLRPYQLEAIEAVEREWKTVRSTVLVLPTGAGKTVVFVDIARRHPERVLVLAHREELIEQAAQKFRAVGVPVEVEKAERRAGKMGTSQVVVASVQTLRGNRLEQWKRDGFGCIIVDECHHAPAKSYRNILDHFSSAKVLGVTATPDRSDEIGLHNVFESTAFSMSILDLIDQGYLVDVHAKTLVVEDFDISAVKTRGGGSKGDLVQEQIEAALTTDKMLHSIAAPLVAEAAGRSTLLFMPGVQSSMDMRRILGAYVDPSKVEHIDGTTHPIQRQAILAAFREKRVQILSNCMVLTEGFDAPGVEVVAICRPTTSRSLFSQMVGRGTRPDPSNPSKKQMTLLNFVPEKTGGHSLANPVDILGGKYVSDEVSEAAGELLKEGMTPREAMTRAERDIAARLAEEEARERAEKERLQRLRESRQQYVYTSPDYHAGMYDIHGGLVESPSWGSGKAASPAQIALLKQMGIDMPVTVTEGTARAAIGRAVERRKKGLCTPKQEKLLTKMGLSGNLSFVEAKVAIDALASNRWKPTPELREKYGRGK